MYRYPISMLTNKFCDLQKYKELFTMTPAGDSGSTILSGVKRVILVLSGWILLSPVI